MEEKSNNAFPIVASLSIPAISSAMDFDPPQPLSPDISLSVPTFEEQPALEKTIPAPPIIRRQSRNLTGITDRSNQKLSQLLAQLEASVILAFNKLVRSNSNIKQDFEAVIDEGKNLMPSSPSSVLLTEYGLDLCNILDKIIQESYNLDDVYQSLQTIKDLQLANQKKSEENANKLDMICSAKEPIRRGSKKKRTFLNVIYAEPTTPSDHLYAITHLIDDIKTNQEILDELEKNKERALENQDFPEEQSNSVNSMIEDIAKALEARLDKINDRDLKESLEKAIRTVKESSQEKEDMPILRLLKSITYWKEIHPVLLEFGEKVLNYATAQQKDNSQNVFTSEEANELLISLKTLANSLSVVSNVPTAVNEGDSDFNKCKTLIKSCYASLQILLSTDELPIDSASTQTYIEESNDMPTVISKATLSLILKELYFNQEDTPSLDSFWPINSLNSWDNVLRELKKVSAEIWKMECPVMYKESSETEDIQTEEENDLKRATELIEEKETTIKSQSETINKGEEIIENITKELDSHKKNEALLAEEIIELKASISERDKRIQELETLLNLKESHEEVKQENA
ncbi:unnamed protein product [Blepharisma stoltei]|uniref:Uncharacterized protein n=1 Tax=Blepharisma stoltei TaxID=1481888 RepID=A0AAU9I8A7_9CILI|nr:unnamed protein product [Blepharisma stoltei]